MAHEFRALYLTERDGVFHREFRDLTLDDLPPGDTLVRVARSSLNYKDGLAVLGKARVVRTYPMVPGIDLAGEVVESTRGELQPGDRVLATGYELGEKHWGGYSQRARIDSRFLVKIPDPLSFDQAMGLGTAGLTAMLSVMALERAGLTPSSGDVLVTGATGGVGSIAVALLSRAGYRVIASTGKTEQHDYLRGLGATDVIDRIGGTTSSRRPLERERWTGAVDNAGGETLGAILPAMARSGAVASCGNAAGIELQTTVLPFILRGVSILGIDSNLCPMPARLQAWNRLADEMPLDTLGTITRTAPLDEVPVLASEILQGKVRGRVVIDLE
jgi:acrylyl-CoA reductase (NADPH)